MTLVIIIGILLILFGLAFITKRRFGVLGLALAAGVLLAQTAGKYVGDILEKNQFPVAPLTPDAAASVLLILLPALLLLVAGPRYSRARSVLIGSAAFAVLATLLILGPLTTALPTQDESIRQSLTVISNWQGVIITAGISVAVLDTLLLHSGKLSRSRHGKH